MNNLLKNISASFANWLQGFFKKKVRRTSKGTRFSTSNVLIGLVLAAFIDFGKRQITELAFDIFISSMNLSLLHFFMVVLLIVLPFYGLACIEAHKQPAIKRSLSRILYLLCILLTCGFIIIASLMAGLGIFCLFQGYAYSADVILSALSTALFLSLSAISAQFAREFFHMGARTIN